MENPKRTVLSPRLGGGPHGLGDPDDRFLRKLEVDVLIPKKVREISKKEKCLKEVEDFHRCCKDTQLLMVVKCRKENQIMKDCLGRWFYDKQLVERCTQEYLKERSEYRRTGLSKKQREENLA